MLQPATWEEMLDISNYVFVSIFACEALLKIAALTFKRYLEDHWNKFDLFIVVISIVTIPFDGPGTSVLRMLRILRIFRLIKRCKVSGERSRAVGRERARHRSSTAPSFLSLFLLVLRSARRERPKPPPVTVQPWLPCTALP